MKYLYILTIIFTCLNSFASNCDSVSIRKQAILLVHADLYDFELKKNENLEDIYNKYEIEYLDQKGFVESIFFMIKENKENDSCEYILVYDCIMKIFYRLKGFKYNEFNDFFNHMVLSRSNVLLVEYSRKEIFRSLYIEKYNLKENYKFYYKKYKNCIFDPTSCHKIIVIPH